MKFFPLADFRSSTNTPTHVREFQTLLFQRTATLEGLQKQFVKILLYPKRRRDKWLEQHQDFIYQMLHHVRRETSYVVNELLSHQTDTQQVTEYMVTLQQTLITLEKIVDDHKGLRA